MGDHARVLDGRHPARGFVIGSWLRHLFQYESGLHHCVEPLGQRAVENGYIERLQACFGYLWSC